MATFMSLKKFLDWLAKLVGSFLINVVKRRPDPMGLPVRTLVVETKPTVLLPVVATPVVLTPEEIEAARKADIIRRAEARRTKRREKLAVRKTAKLPGDPNEDALVAPSLDVPPAETVREFTMRHLCLIDRAVADGRSALATTGSDNLKAVETAIQRAKDAYTVLTTHPSKPSLNGVFSPIKELERAYSKAKAKLEQEATDRAFAEASKAKAAAAEAARLAKIEDDKQTALREQKLASKDYIGRLTKVEMFLEDGRADLARPELEALRADRLKVNGVRTHYNTLWDRRKPMFGYKTIKKLEERLKELEAKRAQELKLFAEREAELNEARTWLSSYFGVEIGADFTTPADYKPRRSSTNRCAVCLAQAKRLILKIGKQDQLMPIHDAMQAYLLRGLQEFKSVQLCSEEAGQARDDAGKAHGHRFFQRRFNLIKPHLNETSGEISDIDSLELSFVETVAKPGFGDMMKAYQRDQIVLKRRKQAKIGDKIEVLAA